MLIALLGAPLTSQGWYAIYSGPERAHLVKRLQPGLRYASRVKVGRGPLLGARNSGKAQGRCPALFPALLVHSQRRLWPAGACSASTGAPLLSPCPAAPQAMTCIGESPYSAPCYTSTQATVPSTPTAPMVAAASETAITVRWEAPADNGAEISGYLLEVDDGR